MGIPKLEACGSLVRTCRNPDGSGGFLVADVPHARPDSHELAQLFAAAPDLLDAARAAADLLTRQKWLPDSTDSEAVVLAKCLAAVAKAAP